MEGIIKLDKISVIIPMYNAECTIERALYSVFSQSYQDARYEVIVVNDGSVDNSKTIVERFINENYKSNYSFYLINQSNGGVSKARNSGLKEATGNYIALLDSDDAWLSEKLEIQLGYFETNDRIDFLGTSFAGFGSEDKKDGKLLHINFKNLLFKNYFQPSTVVFKREILDRVGYFDENQRYAEEGNFFMRVAKEFNCFFLKRNLIIFGDGKAGFGESGLSANLKEMEKGELKNLKFAYRKGWINPALYVFAISFSVLKYIRRILIVKLR